MRTLKDLYNKKAKELNQKNINLLNEIKELNDKYINKDGGVT